MGALPASTFNVRRIAGVSMPRVTTRGERPRAIDSPEPRRAKIERKHASLDMKSESAIVQRAIAGDVDAQERLFAGSKGRLLRMGETNRKFLHESSYALRFGASSPIK
jgi:hypothetical protein